MSNKSIKMENFNDDQREFLRYVSLASTPRARNHISKVAKLSWSKKLNDISNIELLAAHTVVFKFSRSFPFISEERLRYNIEKRNISGVLVIDGRVKITTDVFFECLEWLDE